MPESRELKKHFEAIVGRDLTLDHGGVVLRETVGLYSTVQGEATSRDIGVTGSATKRCGRATLATISGLTFIGASGRVQVRLSDFHCRRLGYLEPVIVVATPRMATPVFVTAVPVLVLDGNDVEITLHSWAPDGSPAPNVLVTWTCRVTTLPTIDSD